VQNLISKKVPVKLDQDLQARIDQIAKDRRSAPSLVLREAISQYIEREEKREALRCDMLNAWDEFKNSGMHSSAEQVQSWLASWGAQNDMAGRA